MVLPSFETSEGWVDNYLVQAHKWQKELGNSVSFFLSFQAQKGTTDQLEEAAKAQKAS